MNSSKAKRRAFEILEAATQGGKPSRAFELFIVVLIAINVLAVVLETVGTLAVRKSKQSRDLPSEIASIRSQ